MPLSPLPGKTRWLAFADQVLSYVGYHALIANVNPIAVARVEMCIANSPSDAEGLARLRALWHEVVNGQAFSEQVREDFNRMAFDNGLPIEFLENGELELI